MSSQRASGDGSGEQRIELHDRAARHIGEERRRKHRDTGVGECFLALRVNDTRAVEAEIAASVMSRVGNHDEVRDWLLACRDHRVNGWPWGQPGKTAKIDVAIDVAIDHEKRLVAKQGQRVGDAARSFQRAWRFR